MKVTYLERIERRTAFSRKMYCPSCGSHSYEIVCSNKIEQNKYGQYIDTNTTEWFVRCQDCGAEGYASPSREIAIARWKQYV